MERTLPKKRRVNSLMYHSIKTNWRPDLKVFSRNKKENTTKTIQSTMKIKRKGAIREKTQALTSSYLLIKHE
jgi:hypothetical protein